MIRKHASSSSTAFCVVGVVAEDHVLGALEIALEQDVGDPWDELGDPRRHSGDARLDVVELLVVVGAQVGRHQPNRPVT